MFHAVLGAGGVGGFIGGALARGGNPVSLLLRSRTFDEHPDILSVSSALLGDFEAPITRARKLPNKVDVLWITVKATQLADALEIVPKRVVGDALVVPLLNGIDHVATLRSVYGDDPVVPATIRVEAERVAPGRILHLSPFAQLRLAAHGSHAEAIQGLAKEIRRAGIDCELVEDEQTMMWSKLAVLAPLALTTTAKGEPLGAVRADPRWSARLESCARETCSVGRLEGARVDLEAVMNFLRTAPESMKSSMQKDVEAGREPELDAIGGAIVRRAKRHGLEVSTTQSLMSQIRSRPGRPA